MKQLFNNIYLQISFYFLIICLGYGLITPTALAHTPHDDVFQVVISPEYRQDKTLFTIVRGNLFKSQNEGQTWQRIIKGLDHKHRLYSLEISTQSANTLFLSSLGDGVYKSQDAGNSWSRVNRGLDDRQIELVKISPRDSDRVLAASHTGLYQTEDGGNNWHLVIQDRITAIAFADSLTVFAGDNEGNLLISQDGGHTWHSRSDLAGETIGAIAISPNFSTDGTLFLGTSQGKIYQSVDRGISYKKITSIEEQPILALAIAPDNILYSVAGYRGVFQSADNGNSWQESSRGLTADKQAYELDRPYYSQLAISPEFATDGTLFLAGYDGLFKSTNRGKSWQEKETLSAKTIVGLGISPNYAKDGTVAVGTYVWGGYLSGNGGQAWQGINQGLLESKRLATHSGLARVFDLVFSPQYARDRTIFSTTWYGMHKSTNSGKSWKNRYWWQLKPQDNPWWSGMSQGAIVALSPDFKRDNTVYLGTMDGFILQSTDRGQNFSLIGQLDAAVIDLMVSPDFKRDRTIYAALPQQVYRSEDGGNRWQSVSKGISFREQYDPTKEAMMQLAISPDFSRDNTIFVGTAEGIFQSWNRGFDWQKLAPTVYGEDSYIEGIALSPDFKSDRTMLVSVRGKGLFQTIDGGGTFKPIGEDLIDNNVALSNLFGFSLTGVSPPIQFSPNYKQDETIFGFADRQVLRSQDGGQTWQALIIPISNIDWLNHLYFDYLRLTLHPKLIVAFTSGASLLIYLIFKLKQSRWRIRWRKFSLKA